MIERAPQRWWPRSSIGGGVARGQVEEHSRDEQRKAAGHRTSPERGAPAGAWPRACRRCVDRAARLLSLVSLRASRRAPRLPPRAGRRLRSCQQQACKSQFAIASMPAVASRVRRFQCVSQIVPATSMIMGFSSCRSREPTSKRDFPARRRVSNATAMRDARLEAVAPHYTVQ